MASDTRKIVIEIKNGTSSNDTSSSQNNGLSTSDDSALKALKVALKPIQTLEKVVVGDSQSSKYIYDLMKGLATESIIFTMNRQYRLTEDYLSQNELNNIQKTLGKAGSMASSVISGAAAGSAIFPGVGTVIGAAVGAAASIATEAISGASTLSNYYSNLNAASYQSGFSARRAGLTNEGRGTEN